MFLNPSCIFHSFNGGLCEPWLFFFFFFGSGVWLLFLFCEPGWWRATGVGLCIWVLADLAPMVGEWSGVSPRQGTWNLNQEQNPLVLLLVVVWVGWRCVKSQPKHCFKNNVGWGQANVIQTCAWFVVSGLAICSHIHHSSCLSSWSSNRSSGSIYFHWLLKWDVLFSSGGTNSVLQYLTS